MPEPILKKPRMPRSVEIPLYIIAIQDDGFHVFLEIAINGHKVYMLLDTGASRTVFDMGILKGIYPDIALEENEDKATGLGSSAVDNFMAVIDTLEIGAFIIKDFEAGVLDISHVNVSYSKINIPAIAGVFGSDIMMRYNAIINYKKKTLKLTK